MKKILFLLTILASITYGQARQSIPDTLRAHRLEINLHADTLTAIRSDIGTNVSNIALRATIASPTFTGTVTIPTLNITSAFKIGGTTVTPSVTELNYVDGVTSPIQTQFTNITDSTAALRTDINSNTASITNFISGEGFAVSSGSQTLNPSWDYNGTLDLRGAVTQIKSTEGLTSTNTNELFFDAEQGTESLYLHTGSEDYYFPSTKILKAKDFISVSLEYPQTADYKFLQRANYDYTIDSVHYMNLSNDVSYSTASVRILHGATYTSAVQLFSTTPYITEQFYSTATGITYSTGWNDRTIATGEQVWLYLIDIGGTPRAFNITIYFTRN